MTIPEMLKQIRQIIAKCDASEREIYEELDAEAEGWRMRLDELDDDED